MNKLSTLLLAATLLLSAQAFSQKTKKDEPKKEDPKHYLDTLGLGLSWRSVGPAVTSGRIGDFAVHPKNKAVYYVATASGGVWFQLVLKVC